MTSPKIPAVTPYAAIATVPMPSATRRMTAPERGQEIGRESSTKIEF